MGEGLHSKYFALNNSFLENKGPRQQVVNPITHEVTFSGKDLIAKQSASSGLNVFGLRNKNGMSVTSNI
jgi:chemotaxis methyl-accepting protein methylase